MCLRTIARTYDTTAVRSTPCVHSPAHMTSPPTYDNHLRYIPTLSSTPTPLARPQLPSAPPPARAALAGAVLHRRRRALLLPAYCNHRCVAPALPWAPIDAGAPPSAQRSACAHWEPDAQRSRHVQHSTPKCQGAIIAHPRPYAVPRQHARHYASAHPSPDTHRQLHGRRVSFAFVAPTSPSSRPRRATVSSTVPPSPLDARACRALQYHPQHVLRPASVPRAVVPHRCRRLGRLLIRYSHLRPRRAAACISNATPTDVLRTSGSRSSPCTPRASPPCASWPSSAVSHSSAHELLLGRTTNTMRVPLPCRSPTLHRDRLPHLCSKPGPVEVLRAPPPPTLLLTPTRVRPLTARLTACGTVPAPSACTVCAADGVDPQRDDVPGRVHRRLETASLRPNQ